ncbi:hypothetical protein [Fibrobacter sp. UBA3806]|uniref:hypothetical protein n=2 Tax=Fibrobacter TaxID=832 RepID=UPI0025B9D5D2|nr:hypothetical protein [Fibrobacter sp. UBA3806]
MKFLRSLLYVFLMAAMCHAGAVADKQMDKVEKFLKKSKYKDAASSLLDYGMDMSKEQKAVGVSQYAGYFEKFVKQHGKVLNHTKLRTRRLSKSYDETVYQINCEKSAWLIVITEYESLNGKSAFSALRVVTEEDVFKYYEKK